VVPSYLAGRWQTGTGDGRPILDAVTGEEVGRLSTSGLDLAGAASYARRTGGPALRELSFHQRASLLKALAGHLREHREELYAVSARTGATLGDSKFDVDGGIGVLAAYASKGKRELPAGTVLVDASGAYSVSGSVVSWTIGSLGQNQTGSRTLRVQAGAPVGTE